MDESRLDAAIALYIRCAGYTPQEVGNELYRHTPAPTDRIVTKGLPTGAGWSGMPLERREILILPTSTPRRNKFKKLTVRLLDQSGNRLHKKRHLFIFDKINGELYQTIMSHSLLHMQESGNKLQKSGLSRSVSAG